MVLQDLENLQETVNKSNLETNPPSALRAQACSKREDESGATFRWHRLRGAALLCLGTMPPSSRKVLSVVAALVAFVQLLQHLE